LPGQVSTDNDFGNFPVTPPAPAFGCLLVGDTLSVDGGQSDPNSLLFNFVGNNFRVSAISKNGTTFVSVPAGGSASLVLPNGTLTVNSDGSYTYVASLHPANILVADTFQFKVLDTISNKETSPQQGLLPDVDYPLITHDANFGVNASGFASGNVLNSVTDQGGKVLVNIINGGSTVPVSGPITITLAHGKLHIQTNGAFTYQFTDPNALTDSFRFTVQDPDGCQSATPLVTISRSSLSGHVFVDFNNDGIQDGPDRGIRNVRITLFILVGRVWVPRAVTFTNAAGVYKFNNLGSGTYRVVCTPPFGFITGKKSVGTVNGVLDGIDPPNTLSNIVFRGAGEGINYNFAFRPSKIIFV
jgi:hypothetical protein